MAARNLNLQEKAAYGVLGLCKLAVLLVTNPRRLISLCRPLPTFESVTSEDVRGWVERGEPFVITSVPFNNWRKDGTPSSTNAASAREIAATIRDVPGAAAHVYTQEEIALALAQLGVHVPESNVYVPAARSAWVQTDVLYGWIAERVRQSDGGLPRNVIIGFAGHVRRCQLVAERIGFTDSRVSSRSRFNNAYDTQGGQAWCTSALRWWRFEYLARIVLLGAGDI